jgi:L-asparaginase
LRFDEQAMEQGLPDPINRHLCYRPALDSSIASLRMFPGLNPALVQGLTEKTGVRVLLLEGYGTGNIPPTPALVEALRAFVIQGGRVVALSQCVGGFVDLERYRSGRQLLDLGAIPGRDITFEAALTESKQRLRGSGP